jgi:glycolate oxidase
VLADGRTAWLGGGVDRPGLDLLGVFVGSEGTLGTITKVLVRLLRIPEAVITLMAAFPTIDAASHAVSEVIAHGFVPAALEMMDQVTVGAVEAHYHAGYPTDAGAVLLAEVDGLDEAADEQAEAVQRLLRENEATDLRRAADPAERELLWAGRKGAIGALGRIRPNYYLHDGVVPRTRLPEVLRRVGEIGREYRLPVANVFHAGDGNLHPNLLFDLRERGVLEQVEKAAEEMLHACIELGGTLSGEHGIGLEKSAFMPWVFSPDDLGAMRRVKDAFDPRGRLNPGKVFPAEAGAQPKLVARTGFAAEANWW